MTLNNLNPVKPHSNNNDTNLTNLSTSKQDKNTNPLFDTNQNPYTVFTPSTNLTLIDFCNKAEANLWQAGDINLTHDAEQWNTSLNKQEQDYIKQILAFFAASDGLVNENICISLISQVKIPEVRYFYSYQIMQESVHSKTYSNLITTFVKNTREQSVLFNAIENHPIIKKKAAWCNKWMTTDKSKFFQNLVAFLAVEGIFFSSSFASIFWLRDRGILANSLGVANEYISRDECLVGSTEVLTTNGWKQITNVGLSDKVGSINMDTQKLEYDNPIRVVKKSYTGELCEFKTSRGYLVTTPNHDMIVYNKFKKQYKKVKALDLRVNMANQMPRISKLDSTSNEKLTNIERLAIAIQADGCKSYWRNTKNEKLARGLSGGYNYSIGIKKERKVIELDKLLNELEQEIQDPLLFKFSKSKIDNRGHFKYQIYINHLHFFGIDYTLKNFDWVAGVSFIHNKYINSLTWNKEFIEELVKWDGYIPPHNHSTIIYSNTNKSCIDIAQAIAIHAGYETYISTIEDNRKDTFSTCYKLSITIRNNPCINAIEKPKIIQTTDIADYDGNVYCLETKNGTLLTRLNNKTFITGNCSHADFAAFLIKKYGMQRDLTPNIINDYKYGELLKSTIKKIILEAVELEKEFVETILPENLVGMNKKLMTQYVEYVADVWLYELTGSKHYNVSQPFQFMQTIGMKGKDNFFEKTRTNYAHTTNSVSSNLDNNSNQEPIDNFTFDLDD
jgi:ribonucleoside-diphosphate reductase beta chain